MKDLDKQNKVSPPPLSKVTTVMVGCKWSLSIFQRIQEGIERPGQIQKSIDGLSTKVMNHCLRKHLEFVILERRKFPKIPPRVEYHITPFGKKFIRILKAIHDLDNEVRSELKIN